MGKQTITRFFIGVLILTFLAGCSSLATVPRLVEIPIPVPCPAPPEIERPILPDVEFVSPKDEGIVVGLKEEELRELLFLIGTLRIYSLELEGVLEGYKEEK